MSDRDVSMFTNDSMIDTDDFLIGVRGVDPVPATLAHKPAAMAARRIFITKATPPP